MITPATAELAIAVAKGLIKLGHRLDVLLAEREAVQGPFVLPMPEVFDGPSGKEMVRQLREHLAATEDSQQGDLLGGDRPDLVEELKQTEPDPAVVGKCHRRLFPEQYQVPSIKPDAAFFAELKRVMPSLASADEETIVAAFHVAAGRDQRGLGYPARLALLVVDVLAEFGAENTALFVRDDGARAIVQSVLQRFAEPQLEEFTEWSPFLRHALSATLNGVLDVRASIVGDTEWLAALLDVLAEARAASDRGDDFVLGLLQGDGYSLLISRGLAHAAEALAEDKADTFKQIASEVLREGATLSAGQRSFRVFFQDHWGDLLRAALSGIERHGPALFEGQPELVRDVSLAMIRALADDVRAKHLSHETLFHLTDAAIAAVAAKPDLLTQVMGDGTPWLTALVDSFVRTVSRQGIRLAFSQEGLDAIITDAAGTFARHPELLIESPGLLQDVVGGILRAVSQLGSLDAKNLATAACQGALTAIAENPALLDTRYAALIADLASRLATLVGERTLTGLDAAAIAEAATQALLRNPFLFDQLKGNLAVAVLDAVLRAAGTGQLRLLAGTTLVATVRELLGVVALHGRPRVTSGTLAAFRDELAGAVTDGLMVAEDELGRNLDLPALPRLLSGLVAHWLRSGQPRLDRNSAAFRDLFGALSQSAIAQA